MSNVKVRVVVYDHIDASRTKIADSVWAALPGKGRVQFSHLGSDCHADDWHWDSKRKILSGLVFAEWKRDHPEIRSGKTRKRIPLGPDEDLETYSAFAYSPSRRILAFPRRRGSPQYHTLISLFEKLGFVGPNQFEPKATPEDLKRFGQCKVIRRFTVVQKVGPVGEDAPSVNRQINEIGRSVEGHHVVVTVHAPPKGWLAKPAKTIIDAMRRSATLEIDAARAGRLTRDLDLQSLEVDAALADDGTIIPLDLLDATLDSIIKVPVRKPSPPAKDLRLDPVVFRSEVEGVLKASL